MYYVPHAMVVRILYNTTFIGAYFDYYLCDPICEPLLAYINSNKRIITCSPYM